MKLLAQDSNNRDQRNLVYLSAQENPTPEKASNKAYTGVQAGGFIDNLNLSAANDNNPILNMDQESGSGMHAADTVETFNNRINDVIEQGSDGAINAGIGGSYLAKIFTPPEFKGYTNLYLLNPLFAAPAGLTPATVITQQLKQGFDSLGDPAELLGDSPLLSIKMAKSLVKKDQIEAAIDGAKSGGGHFDDMSLTSLQILESVNDKAFEAVNKTNESRAAEFYAKSGRDLETGKRDEETGAVWWKRATRKVLGQNFLYRKRVSWAKNRYKEGYDEIRSNIRSLKRSKEEAIFGAQQEIDQFLLPRTEEGSANTVELDAGRKVLHLIINRPNQFASNPAAFEVNGVSAYDIFGQDLKVLDVLEALRSPHYEYLTNNPDSPNYLDSAIKTGQWQFNHHNSLRTLRGIQTRATALESFSSTNIENLERFLTQHYEPSGSPEIKASLDNPRQLVGRLIEALGSAGVDLGHNLNKIIKNGDIYSSANEIFWHLFNFLGKDSNLSAFKALPPDLQGDLAEFFLQKRSQLEEATISGGIEERGSLIWRVEALKQGRIVSEHTQALATALPDLAEKLISTDKGVAQEALRTIKTLSDHYNYFLNLIGVSSEDGVINKKEVDSLFVGLPEFEKSLLSNIIDMYPKMKGIFGVYSALLSERKKVEELIDQAPERVEELRNQQVAHTKHLESGEPKGVVGNVSRMLDLNTSGTGDGSNGGGDIETYETTVQREIDRLGGYLDGEKGGIAQLEKIKNFTFENLPGDISQGLNRMAERSQRSIDRRLNELGLHSDADIAALLDADKKPSLNTLARNELWNSASKSLVETGRALIGNDALQQFENMKKTAYVGLQTLTYVSANYQSQLTVKGLTNPNTLQDALYVRAFNGGYLYHTDTQVILINPPRHSSDDQRNVAIWNKAPEEKGLDNKFTLPYGQPDELGIFLTANPENSAASENALYGPVQRKVDNLLAANDNFAPKKIAT